MDTELSFFQKLRNKLSVHRENNPGIFVFIFIIVINIAMIALSSGLLLFLPENISRNDAFCIYAHGKPQRKISIQ